MEAYKLFVRKNREFVHSLESLANVSNIVDLALTFNQASKVYIF